MLITWSDSGVPDSSYNLSQISAVLIVNSVYQVLMCLQNNLSKFIFISRFAGISDD
jgi:hypothetical protein